MAEQMDGFWQVVYDDPRDEFVRVERAHTNVSLRRAGFLIYAAGWFAHIRVESGRVPTQRWPPPESERVRLFRSATAAAGRASWRREGDRWIAEHEVTMSPDPRRRHDRFTYVGAVDGDRAETTVSHASVNADRENWRRLSGAGSSPLAGAWQSGDDSDAWLLVVSAGHYAVVHQESTAEVLPQEGDLDDRQVVSIFDTFGSNAGAVVETATSFDTHPFISSNSAGYDAAKHPSFFLSSIDADRALIGFEDDGSDAQAWNRVG